MSTVLKVKGNDGARERDFALKSELMYTPDERVCRMFEISKRILIIAKKYAARKTYRIIQRPAKDREDLKYLLRLRRLNKKKS